MRRVDAGGGGTAVKVWIRPDRRRSFCRGGCPTRGNCQPSGGRDAFLLGDRQRVKKGLHRGFAVAPAALVRSRSVVLGHPSIEVELQLLDRRVDPLAKGDAGGCQVFCVKRAVPYGFCLQRAEGSNRSPNRMANCPIAAVHSTRRRHLTPAFRIARNSSFRAASSVGKLPLSSDVRNWTLLLPHR